MQSQSIADTSVHPTVHSGKLRLARRQGQPQLPAGPATAHLLDFHHQAIDQRR
jgi:hypothetical protein